MADGTDPAAGGPESDANGTGPDADGQRPESAAFEPPALALADRAAYLPAADALVCADLHLGRDAQSNVEFPLGERSRVPRRIEALVERFEPAELVLAGDVLHAFDSVPDGARTALGRVREVVESASVSGDGASGAGDAGADGRADPDDASAPDLVHVAGNHDTMLGQVLDSAPHVEYRLADGTVVCHGDEQPELDADRYVVGHDHPAIVVEGDRRPCYLHGPAAERDATVLVLPAFNELTRGTVINGATGGDLETPLVADAGRMRPAVRDPDAGETLWFPPLAELRRLL